MRAWPDLCPDFCSFFVTGLPRLRQIASLCQCLQIMYCTTFYVVTVRQYTTADQYAFQALYSTFCLSLISLWGPGLHIRHNASLRAGRFGVRTQMVARYLFSTPTLPDQPWSPYSLLYDGYQGSFWGVKLPGHGIDRPSPSTAKYMLSPFCISMVCEGKTFTLITFCGNGTKVS